MTTDMEFLEPVQRWRDNVDQADGDVRRSLILQWKEKIIEDLVDVLEDEVSITRLFILHGQILSVKVCRAGEIEGDQGRKDP
jgi:hypothetical protein